MRLITPSGTLVGLLAISATSLSVPSLPAATATAVATCRGLPVTVGGLPNTTITGTDGDDVILAPFGTYGFVDAGAGNDVICVVPGGAAPDYPEPPSYNVLAGPGDDVIDSTALSYAQGTLFVPSSPGSDTFYGGDEPDQLTIPAVNGVPPSDDTEADVFLTGGGNDVVMSGSRGLPNGDVIDLGDGHDTVLYAGSGAAGDGHVDGGPGRDALWPSAHDPVDPPDDPLPPGDVVVDARSGTATVGGSPYLTWTEIEEYELGDIEDHHVRFLGSGRREVLTLSRGPITALMGGGNDSVYHYYPRFPEGRVAGGPGRDHLYVNVRDSVTVELGSSAVLDDDPTVRLLLSGFDTAAVYGGRSVVLRGTPRGDQLAAIARRSALIEGRSGDDKIRLGYDSGRGLLSGNRRVARGGAGDDRLIGSSRADSLFGGGGRDVATGYEGTDTCVAEVRRFCER